MLRGRFISRYHRHFEVMPGHEELRSHIYTRLPRPLTNNEGFLLPFNLLIWSLIVGSLLCMSLMFLATHTVYSRHLQHAGLHSPEDSHLNFVLYTFCKITEPDPVPWFTNKWSTGKLLAFTWSVFSLLIISFYNSNLRAYLTAVDYEKPIDNSQDLLDSGIKTWLISEMAYTS